MIYSMQLTLSTTFHDGESPLYVSPLAPLASEPVSQIWSQWRQLLEGLVPTSLHGMFHGLHWPQMATGISGLRTGQQGLELPFPENSQVALRPCWKVSGMGPKPGTMVNPRIARICGCSSPKNTSTSSFSPMANVACHNGLLLGRLHVQPDLKFQLLPKKRTGFIPLNQLQFWRIPRWNSGIRASLKFEMLLENKTIIRHN